ncbi:hypothetical protein QBC39DRAFT_422487 [Podospora conica]|nr:hypothetical protein QBC39DRAFT_422487 [Schizothecium conicum]
MDNTMEYLDLYHRPYAGSDIQQYHGLPQQPHGQPYGMPGQYPPHPQFWNPHAMAYFQQQHQQQQRAAAVMMGHAGMHGSKQTEPKPRLAKDEVELLEREFTKNQKPNSSTKRELAEQMGVEVPRINNWFQNRRAKEKQLKKTAEFEAQQAQQRDSSEPKSSDEQDQEDGSEFYGQPLAISTAPFGRHGSVDDSDGSESDRQQSAACEELEHATPGSTPPSRSITSPSASPNDNYVPERDASNPPVSAVHVMSEFVPDDMRHSSFGHVQQQDHFQQPPPYVLAISNQHLTADNMSQGFNGLPECIALPPSATVDTFAERDFFEASGLTQFPSQLLEPQAHLEPIDAHIKTESVSPHAMSESSSVPPEVRFKSPPPPADIAGRRKLRRPAPLVATALRGAPHIAGPKTGIDQPRRSETASPMRRISSASGLPGRVQKSFSSSMGPRSPFTMDRNKEALLQRLQTTQSPTMASLNSVAFTPLTPEGMSGQQVLQESPMSTSPEDDQGFTFGPMGAVGHFSMYNAEVNVKTPPDTPGLPNHFPDHFFSSTENQAWNFLPQEEPLPTPSLCSHDGSERQFSMTQIPGYMASQPATPSFPPSIGPAYTGGGFYGNTEYNFPDSYGADSSARSSPAGPPKSKQFQFAQNVTPQDFNER